MFIRQILRCPVGKEVLGHRQKDEAAALYCEDCDHIYVWEPNKSIPKAKKADHKDHSCGCGNCGR